MGVQPIYCKGATYGIVGWFAGRTLGGGGWGGGITVRGVPNRPNYCVILMVLTLFGTVAVVRVLETHVIGVKGT